MGTRVPVQHYNLNSPSSFIESPLHVLNAVDARTAAPSPIDHIAAPTPDPATHDSAAAVDCMNESHRSCFDEDRSSLETNESSRGTYDILTIEDVSPIETARARFLQIVVDHFIDDHVIEVADSEADYSGQDKLDKRRNREIQYEGDPNFALPLMYVANMYETLVNDVNMRLASLNGIREKTIGVALEAAGGLYRRLAKKFPKKGPRTYKRRELATSMETRTRFPELVIQEEKRVRFVVVNGLKVVEKPNTMSIDDAEWFKRLTGRNEVAISADDYKFYSPRHKFRRAASISLSNIPDIPSFPGADNSSTLAINQGFRSQTPTKHHLQSLPHQPQFHAVLQNNQAMHQSPHAGPYSHNHQSGPPSHLSEISHAHQPTSISQHMNCLQPLTGGHVGGRLHMLPPTPAKYCDECGAPYLRETSKFCSECGSKRLGI
ncbi:uncharacterized protein At2g02148 [Arachis ipaensis]|uniref:Uncharacterized protein n=2 Tax=Arachis hypogaea TaxID=3818 RepID=A0A445DLX4_ARAHY|nr:uncharacterized protein At2g02148 [Arachis ipaensis]XP_016191257.1 uncharacterized protein At2g02148 [Arachis ipaensis]XP_016191259.1 uncharacterized protein At2g02148 [Arachis ipaensis]XP_025639875.1 uncharacterized protein At2g02148 isoform X1 [Arachis hypogaea]XP_025639876.1 uncharacterized protein At2g02148 isoform X1 [Arachis hypogaea]XP_025639877.1 uncharacterized protein At2g02148 isoform X1 [Arachis hypogaea]XP_025639878.1 uncharacterized protein At2g02148 isoform X1 [Arachis hypog